MPITAGVLAFNATMNAFNGDYWLAVIGFAAVFFAVMSVIIERKVGN